MAVTLLDLGEVTKGHYIKIREKNLGMVIYCHKYIKLDRSKIK